MKLKLENVGMIGHADIRLDGLTIIAGENDTGKSTVGKLMFSLIKAFNRYEQDLNEGKLDKIHKLMQKTYFQLREQYNFEKYPEFKKEFYPRTFFNLLQINQDNAVALINHKISFLKERGDLDSIENLESIKKIYLKDEDKEIVIKRALKKVLISEFYLELTPKNSSLISQISSSEGVNKLFEISLNNNVVENLTLYDDLSFNDVTYIETPIFLQMYELINSASNLFELTENQTKGLLGASIRSPTVALHTKDLISKLENAQYFQLLGLSEDNRLSSALSDILNLTKGMGFTFDSKERDFYFNKNNDTKFKSINTATGLKSFGMIQLLIQANILNERSLLIIDEPEIHLHPKWQVKYAKLIVMLVKNDIPVLVTSHSPEIIQALTVFSKQFGIKDRTAYYLTESNGIVSDITDVTEDINKIFIKLAEPLHDLVWD